MADELKTKPATLRLTAPVIEALERFRVDREKALQRMLPGYELSQSGALAALVAGYLEKLGYFKADEPEAPEATEKPVAVERRKHPRSTVKPAVLLTQKEKVREGIEADLIAGAMTQREIAAKWKRDEGRVSRIKKQLKEKGLMQ
jgi:hypothetical protein